MTEQIQNSRLDEGLSWTIGQVMVTLFSNFWRWASAIHTPSIWWLGITLARRRSPPIQMPFPLPELAPQLLPPLTWAPQLPRVSSETHSRACTRVSRFFHVVPTQLWDLAVAILAAPWDRLSKPCCLTLQPDPLSPPYLPPADQEPNQILFLLFCPHCYCLKWDGELSPTGQSAPPARPQPRLAPTSHGPPA